jgi:hypothetical protein
MRNSIGTGTKGLAFPPIGHAFAELSAGATETNQQFGDF